MSLPLKGRAKFRRRYASKEVVQSFQLIDFISKVRGESMRQTFIVL
ncbi:MAG: hypothetical protein QOH70_288, partial [Blastocatellia bacterium]|nr:hypothetical protein [Blastocatellia bacterium]